MCEAKEEQEDQQEPFVDRYSLACGRCDKVTDLSEETISAILSLHGDGVPVKTIQEAYGLPIVILNLIIGDYEKEWEEFLY